MVEIVEIGSDTILFEMNETVKQGQTRFFSITAITISTPLFTTGGAPRLLDQMRGKIRLKHYSLRTKQSYTDWIKRFIRHFDKTNNSPTSRLTIDSDNRIEEWPLRKVGTPRVLPAGRVGDTAPSENMAQHMPR